MIKVVTGIRRCGKSYSLDPIFKNYLISSGIQENHIIKLDLIENSKYRDPMELFNYVMQKIVDKDMHYVLMIEVIG